ncbi:MAG: hypothetical protein GX663_01310 [Clostridiales bacterium]|nr:hypothetical protein [Clostridiales bacterium]
MISYEIFVGIVQERITEYLPAWFGEYKVKIDKKHKINQERDFLTIAPTKEKGSTFVCPAIPLSEVYTAFGEEQDMESLLHYLADIIVNNFAQFNDQDLVMDFVANKDKIVMNIVNTEKNKELLEGLPHRDILDFSIIYRFIMQREGNGYGTVVLNNSIMDEINLEENELFDMALENTRRLFPMNMKNMGEMFYIISNSHGLHGSAYIAHSDVLGEMYDKVKGNYYIIPTSLHEFVVVGIRYISLLAAKDMLIESMREVCHEGEFLSDNIYYYDGRENQLKIA